MQPDRLFIAIDLSPEVIKRLSNIVQWFQRQKINGIRWVRIEQIHLTLRFLGDTHLDQTQRLRDLLSSTCRRVNEFDLDVEGCGCFPNNKTPRVLWVGVKAPNELYNLQKEIEADVRHIGFSPEKRPFSPHLTLGRLSQYASKDDLAQITRAIQTCNINHLGVSRVNHVTLYRSTLKQNGPIYDSLGIYPFVDDDQ